MTSLPGLVFLMLSACSQARPPIVALRWVTVVDVADGSLRSDQTVLVDGNRIAAVGPAGEVRVPEGADVVDATGGYVLPGLWDSHVHSVASSAWHFPLLVAHGVTSVRNLHTTAEAPLETLFALKNRLVEGELLGPRLLANGPILDGDPPVWPGSIVVRTEDEAREAVNFLANGGADFIKVYDNLTREAYFAILDEARRRDIPVDGHIPFRVDPQEAAEAGQRTDEHMSGMSYGCSTALDAVRADSERALANYASMSLPEQILLGFRRERALHDSRDPVACAATVEAYRQNGVAVVPTLVVGHNSLHAAEALADASSLRRIPEETLLRWREEAGSELSVEIAQLMRPTVSATLQNVRLLNEAGVTLLAGTDLGNPLLVPGLSLHQELARLVEAGLSPLEALQAATLSPARVFGLADSLGTVAAGKLADLVLLDADPLADIRNTRRIRAVVADGRLYRRADLERLLSAVEAAHEEAEKHD